MIALMRLFVVVLGACVTVPAVATTQNIADMVDRWDLLGTWSLDCSRPPSVQNYYLSFVRQGTEVMWVHDFGTRRDSGSVLAASIGPDGLITISLSGGARGADTPTYLRGPDGRWRTIATRDGAGTFWIEDGRYVVNGASVQWHQRCY